MEAVRTPVGVWTRRWGALALVLVLAPLLLLLSLDPGDKGDAVMEAASSARDLLVATAVLVAAACLYLHWRISGSDTTGWLALLLAAAAGPGVAWGSYSLTHPDAAEAGAGWIFVFQVAILLGLLAALLVATPLLARGVRVPGDPLAIGLAAGLGVACVRQVVLVEARALPAAPSVVQIVVIAILAVSIAAAVLRLPGLPLRIGAALALSVLVLGAGLGDGGRVAVGSSLLGAAALAVTAAAVLHHAIEDDKRELDELQQRLHAVETGLREDRARLHEINTTVAGIASAQKLMADGLDHDRTDALADMMRAEVQRLQRLVVDHKPRQPRSVDLDDAIGQIVLSHLARGRVVVWEPTGLRALGRADDIAEVVNVLLENAAVHGGPDAVSIRVARDLDSHTVSVTVSDQGPGVPPHLVDRIFDWGVSGADSPGQGIGLHVAADLARDLGGRLELLPTTTGATFQLCLPAATEEVGTRGHDARAS